MRYKTDAIIAAIIYMACKEEQYPRTFKEISRETNIIEKEIRKYYRTVNKLLERQDMRTSAADLVVCGAQNAISSVPFQICLHCIR